jgi:hypothetical protein
MEGLIPLLLTAGIGGGFLYAAKKKEGFAATIDAPVETAMRGDFLELAEAGSHKFNPILNLTDPNKNPFFPQNASSSEITQQDAKVKQALGSAIASPSSEGVQLRASDTSLYDITQTKGGATLEQIRRCERLRASSCDAFSDPNFAEVCGVCLEGGRDSGGNTTLGGLFISADDKLNARESAARMGAKRVSYIPSVGQCAPGAFAVNKAQCETIKKRMECEKKQNFQVSGCSQCYQDETFYFLDDTVELEQPHLVLVGQGKLSVSYIDASGKLTTLQKDLSATPTSLITPKFNEGDILELQISPADAKVAGYLVGNTATGEFTMDIIRLIQVDLESNAKPRMSGFETVNGIDVTLIRPAVGKTSMRLPVRNVFSFVAPNQSEAASCAAAPFIKQSSSAEFLNSGPCYKKGQQPGRYSLECLQGVFLNAGCTVNGEGYPSNDTKAKALMQGAGGNQLTIAQIAGTVYEANQAAFSGQQGGKKMSLAEWNQVSRFCTGKRLENPCDADNKASGPLSADCLSYLWQNTGAIDKKPGALGPTYSNTLKPTSLNGNTVRYCTSSGTMAPINAQGQYNQTAIAAAHKAGGVEAVKALYNQIHSLANDNGQSDARRKAAIEQCYGVSLEPLPDATIPGSPEAPSTSCVPQTIIPQLDGGTPSKVYATLNFKQSWNLTMIMQPSGTPGGPSFDNILLFTGNRRDEPEFGARVLGLWFFPYSNRLHVSGSTDKNRFWSINTDGQLPLNKDTNVSISCDNNKITLKCSGGLNEERTQDFPTPMYTGRVELFAPGPAHPSFKGRMTNLSFCTFTNNTTSVLDSRPGRTKSALQRPNYTPMDWSPFSKPVVVLGSYGMQPWGTWWASGFPANSGAKWIWTRADAANDEPNWNWQQFFYRYTNTKNTAIQATLIIAADNVASILINDALVGNSTENVTRVNITVQPGENKFQINVANRGGPAGLCVAAQDASGFLFVSDGRWTTTL